MLLRAIPSLVLLSVLLSFVSAEIRPMSFEKSNADHLKEHELKKFEKSGVPFTQKKLPVGHHPDLKSLDNTEVRELLQNKKTGLFSDLEVARGEHTPEQLRENELLSMADDGVVRRIFSAARDAKKRSLKNVVQAKETRGLRE
eukprot:TRINITY_DN1984_c0_g1_i1.p1 TRINITY_DN1984_c0_g1~~TRINITY_DN1984_c0_g1_i1.p1  ORF type:complete len:143 (-),score=47.62 TRINITY_DN1984_c0_g1_i1:51-479(-)